METSKFSNPQLIQRKIQLIDAFHPLKTFDQFESIDIIFHQTPLRFFSKNHQFVNQLKKYYPTSWFTTLPNEEFIEIYIEDAKNHFNDMNDWDNEISPDCLENNFYIIQRDFISKEINQNCFHLICEEKIDDGFFNFLRWLLPNKFLKRNQLLLHSSAVCFQGKGHLFLGKSGHGKSTTCHHFNSRFKNKDIILNDDMNILSIINKANPTLSPAGLGGLFEFKPQYIDNPAPLKSVFWLEKDDKNFVEKIPLSKMASLLFASISNINWSLVAPSIQESILEQLLITLSQVEQFGILHLRKDSTFVDLII